MVANYFLFEVYLTTLSKTRERWDHNELESSGRDLTSVTNIRMCSEGLMKTMKTFEQDSRPHDDDASEDANKKKKLHR